MRITGQLSPKIMEQCLAHNKLRCVDNPKTCALKDKKFMGDVEWRICHYPLKPYEKVLAIGSLFNTDLVGS